MKIVDVGEKIYNLRQHKGWSQRKLAKEANLSQSSIVNIENGNFKLNNLDTVDKIINALNTSFDFLFESELKFFKTDNSSKIDMKIKNELYQMDNTDLELVISIIFSIKKYKESKNRNQFIY